MSSSTGMPSKSPLDAAQKIVAELQGMVPEQQLLAIRFSVETLGLNLPTAVPTTATAQPTTSPHAPASSPITGIGHSTDVKAFTALKSPRSDQQFVAVVAYFYQFEAPADQRRPSIDVEVVKNAARLAGWEHPPQWRFTLQNAKNAGYLDSAGDGAYKLSSVGENLVAINLPGNAGPVIRPNGSKKKGQKKAKKASGSAPKKGK